MEAIKDASAPISDSKLISPGAALWDPRSRLKTYLLWKYLQVLVLPLGGEVLASLGALASLHTARLLRSPRVSHKASAVLLGQLAWADGLVAARWGLAALAWALEDRGAPEDHGALGRLGSALWTSNQRASLLFLSCLSLEALLVAWRPVESRGLRTVRTARLARALVWAAVAAELLVRQAAEQGQALHPQGPVLQGCLLGAAFLQGLSRCLRGALWLANVWVCYALFYSPPQRRKSCFH